MISVFHAVNPKFSISSGAEDSTYVHVADVDVTDSEHAAAFELTNTIDNYWWDNPSVTANFESPAFREMNGMKGTRSTSVGDVIVLSDGSALQCASFGWESINVDDLKVIKINETRPAKEK